MLGEGETGIRRSGETGEEKRDRGGEWRETGERPASSSREWGDRGGGRRSRLVVVEQSPQ